MGKEWIGSQITLVQGHVLLRNWIWSYITHLRIIIQGVNLLSLLCTTFLPEHLVNCAVTVVSKKLDQQISEVKTYDKVNLVSTVVCWSETLKPVDLNNLTVAVGNPGIQDFYIVFYHLAQQNL